MNELAIIITTCDKFCDLWKNNSLLVNKFWPNHPPIYLVSDKDNYLGKQTFDNFMFFDGDYSFRLKQALNHIDAEYVFLTLDDYLISNYVDKKKIDFLFSFMQKNKLSYLRFFKQTLTKGWIDKENQIHLLPLTKCVYEVNLYPSIWKKEDLLKMIVNDESPWKFEVRLTRRAREHNLFCGWVENKKVFPFVDTIRKGKYLRKAYRFLKKNDLYISSRPKMTIFETLRLDIRTLISRHAPKKIKNWLKKMSKGKYYSDYYNTDD